MNLDIVLKLISSLTAINLFIIYNEYYSLRKLFTHEGIYTSNTVSQHFNQTFIGKIVNWMSTENKLKIMLIIAISFTLVISIYHHPLIYLYLILVNFYFSFKTEGAFNGGSDYMTILTLITLFLSYTFKGNNLFVNYLALQLILSYFLAGVVKLKSESWRHGHAVKELFIGPNYAPPTIIKKIVSNNRVSLILCWIVIILELFFPFMFLTKNIWIIFAFGSIFHFFNFLCFGLNRFFWAWIATYPSLIYLLTILPSTK